MGAESWYQVDNVAKVFLATYNRRDTRSMRVSCTLKEEVKQELLQQALNTAIVSRPQYQVRIRRGFFWHYLESTEVLPKVEEENDRPCPILYGDDHTGVLHYRVSYFGKRINLDMFHALSDGTGALEFLNLIVLNYLKLRNPDKLEKLSLGSSASADDLEQNSFDQFYTKNRISLAGRQKAYHIRGKKLPYNQLQFFEAHLPAKPLLTAAKSMQVSLTAYLGAQLMMAIHADMPLLKRKQPITITMPVNLRNFYPSKTARNFFNNVTVSYVFTGEETLEAVAKIFEAKLRDALVPEKIQKRMGQYQELERLFLFRMVPLLIKQPVIRLFSKRENRSVSAVLSNLGIMHPPEGLEEYIDNYACFCSHNELFFTISSYGGEMTFGISSAYHNTGVLKNFIRSLKGEEDDGLIYATEVIK